MTEKQKEDIRNIIKNPSKILWNESMKKHTTLKVGGNAQCLIEIKDEKSLIDIIDYARKENIPITILGNGSNILVLDSGIKGITLKIHIQKLEIEDKKVKIGAGNKVIQTAYKMLENNLSGMEELSGIPGTIGGAIYMNAGANGKEMKDIVSKIIYLDEFGNKKEMLKDQAEFSYRHSIFSKHQYIILEVTINLQKDKKENIKERMEKYSNSRKNSQPIEYPNAGSTFKRGNDYITAKLIDECGLKGYRIGGAEVSTKHAGFIINKGNASAQDVLSLVNYVQDKVYERFKKKIQLEMKIIGEE